MAVKKNKQRKRKPPKKLNNFDVFNWTPQRKKAAFLLADGTKTYDEVAKEVRVKVQSLWNWRKYPAFLEEVDIQTLKNEEVTRAGLLRLAIKGIQDNKEDLQKDKNTALDWAKFAADIQGYMKQKVELDADLKHSVELDVNLTEEELQKAIDEDLQKLIAVGYIPDSKKNTGEPTETIEN
jgi:hypothetical protein